MTEPAMNPSTSSTAFPSGKVLVNKARQEGNPVLKYLRSVPYEWSADIKVDFECSRNCGVLYLSLKYHKLHPGYIETRFSSGSIYAIKILLGLVNIEDPTYILRDLNMYCYRSGWTLVLCYSVEESATKVKAAEYLENFKLSEKRTPDSVINGLQEYKQRKQGGKYNPSEKEKNQKFYEQAVKYLSSIRSINISDAKRLLGTFGSISAVSRARAEDLEKCPGISNIKATNIHAFFDRRL